MHDALDALHREADRGAVAHVGAQDLDPAGQGAEAGERRLRQGAVVERAHAMALGQQMLHQVEADEAAGPGDEIGHAISLAALWPE